MLAALLKADRGGTPPAGRDGPARQVRPLRNQSSSSTQSKVFVTAFFHLR